MKYLNLFLQKIAVADGKQRVQRVECKNTIKKSSFFNEISLEYKVLKLP